MSYSLFTTQDVQNWNSVIKKLPYCFEYTAEYATAIEKAHNNPCFLFAHETRHGVTIIPFSVRQYQNTADIYSPYGTYGVLSSQPVNQWLPVWLDFVATHRYICSYLLINPFFPFSDDPVLSESLSDGSPIYTLNLALSLPELFSHFNENSRRVIKKLQNSSREVVHDKFALTPVFLKLYDNFIARTNAKSLYHFSESALISLIEQDHAFLIGVKNGPLIESVSLFFYSHHICNFFLGASLEEAKQSSRLVFWEALNYCKKLNIPLFNFGGGIQPHDSLAQFKKSFGCQETPVAILKQVYNKPVFDTLCGQKNPTHFFPPYYG